LFLAQLNGGLDWPLGPSESTTIVTNPLEAASKARFFKSGILGGTIPAQLGRIIRAEYCLLATNPLGKNTLLPKKAKSLLGMLLGFDELNTRGSNDFLLVHSAEQTCEKNSKTNKSRLMYILHLLVFYFRFVIALLSYLKID
jgi:hypothetical protein